MFFFWFAHIDLLQFFSCRNWGVTEMQDCRLDREGGFLELFSKEFGSLIWDW